ncbi:MAG: hypothetical protein KME30_21830 [Iphinoe sp. HA4291-MV1]|nr:hypothetical protein [Iphinoe sp. HA4291-MV1]
MKFSVLCFLIVFGSVPGAIADLKEALRTWKRVESLEAVIVEACKKGLWWPWVARFLKIA